jgi:hypothetical protein
MNTENGPTACFWNPQELTERLATAPVQWCVIGGWALDLWLGVETRPHHDLEIALPRMQFPLLSAALSDLKPYSIRQGELCELNPGAALPAERHQARFMDPAKRVWRLDVMVDPGHADTWVYRRDERLRAPRRELMGWRGAIPYMKPEGVLLFKARTPREKDERDFAHCLAHLPGDAARWLARCLQDFYPQHAWLPRLQEICDASARA